MSISQDRLLETITLRQARDLIRTLAHKQSLLLLSPPGVGKSDVVLQAATEAGLPCRSLLGTQIAPEDVSGVPRIVGERSVFCPPRVLLPEQPEPFCLFLDEMPACAPDVQKAFYSLLLERRLGEHRLPPGTWVVAAGNRLEDRSLVRSISSALINRVTILQVRVDVGEWLEWAEVNNVRADIRNFIRSRPEGLMRPVPTQPIPFSTPRAWASLSRSLDLTEQAGRLTKEVRRALAQGRVTTEDALAYCAWVEAGYGDLRDWDLERKLDMSLAELELSVRATNCLESEGIITVRDLVVRTDEELLEVRNFGERQLKEVQEKLAEQGLRLGMQVIGHHLVPRSTSGGGESLTLSQVKSVIHCLAQEQSLLLLSPPGVGKSDTVLQAAAEAGLACRSLLGTQIAPEDVSGIPRIVGERSVFCPPRVLLPEQPEPFCLFLDELPACAPDVQKAFYSLLLERRLGEHPLPSGTWVVSAGNRLEDRALVRSLSSALINRVIVIQVRVDVKEWLMWARAHGVRSEILSFITFMPEALFDSVPIEPVPFSTPRAWAALSEALDLAEATGLLDRTLRRALAFGRVNAEHAAVFCAMAEESIQDLQPPLDYVLRPEILPTQEATRWFILCRIRGLVQRGDLDSLSPEAINRFLMFLPQEHRFALLVDMVDSWGRLGAEQALFETLREVTGL